MKIKCICSKEIVLDLLLIENQDEYQGDCECGRKWSLKELSETLAEIDDC
jgi:hypothetical protein